MNGNTLKFILSSGIFTKACGSNSTPTRKCRSCFLGRMSSIPVTTVSKGTTWFLSPTKKKKKKIKIKYKKPFLKHLEIIN
jgi:hypothetical protein